MRASTLVASEDRRQVLDRDPSQLEVAIRIWAAGLELADQMSASFAQLPVEASGPVMLESTEPREEWLHAPRGNVISRFVELADCLSNAQQPVRGNRPNDPVWHPGSLENLHGADHQRILSTVPTSLDSARLSEITQAIVDRIEGDWLLIGGALVALWLEPRRTTADIDLVPMEEPPQNRMALFEMATELGLPIEALNSAADFFVEGIPGWRDEAEVFLEGRTGRIFRPSPTVFLILKMGRLSEVDLGDCLELLKLAQSRNLQVDTSRAIEALERLPPVDDSEVERRRDQLRNQLEKHEAQAG